MYSLIVTTPVNVMNDGISFLKGECRMWSSRCFLQALRICLSLLWLCSYTACSKKPPSPDLSIPWDPDDPSFVPPKVEIITAPSSMVNDPEVIFGWKGGKDVKEFSYKLDDKHWSDWSSETSDTFYLDEGEHTFSVKGKYPVRGTEYPTGVEGAPVTTAFTVDAVKGPAIMIWPRQQRVAPGQEFQVQGWVEEVEDLMLVHSVLGFDPSKLEFVSAKDGDISWAGNEVVDDDATVRGVIVEDGDISWAGNGGKVLSVYLSGDSFIDISIGVVEGNPEGLNGSGPIITFVFRAKAVGRASLTFEKESVAFRNSKGDTIAVEENRAEHVSGEVIIE